MEQVEIQNWKRSKRDTKQRRRRKPTNRNRKKCKGKKYKYTIYWQLPHVSISWWLYVIALLWYYSMRSTHITHNVSCCYVFLFFVSSSDVCLTVITTAISFVFVVVVVVVVVHFFFCFKLDIFRPFSDDTLLSYRYKYEHRRFLFCCCFLLLWVFNGH